MSDIFCFDDFELNVARFELRHRGRVLEVQPKVLRLILYLVTHRDRVVPVDELLRELWPEATVTAGSVKRAVLGARQVLESAAGECSSIRTVRGAGYQFSGEVHTQLASAGPLSSRATDRKPPRLTSRSRSTPLVGREPLMTTLRQRMAAARIGCGQCVLLTGPPGIGKSRVAEELGGWARGQGALVWSARCTTELGGPALWPLQQILRDALEDLGRSLLVQLLGGRWTAISRAVPDLNLDLDAAAAAPLVSSESERFRLFEHVCEFLRGVAVQQQVVLSIDDVHVADQATMQLLSFLVHQLDFTGISLLATLRHDSSLHHDADGTLANLLCAQRTFRVELQGLDQASVARYVLELTGQELPEATLLELQGRTAGNPLFVRQLVETWVTRSPTLELEALSSSAESMDLQAAIHRHLSLMPAPCRAHLRAAAVLGREFSSPLLVKVTAGLPEDVWRSLSHAEANHLVEPVGEMGAFRFTHALICDALYRQLPMMERARLHGLAGAGLEAQGIGDNHVLLAEMTRHFVRAAPTHDGGRALSYSMRAAGSALSRLAYEEAAEHFQRALQLHEYQPPDPAVRTELLLRRAEALTKTADRDAARDALYEVIALGRALGNMEPQYRATVLLAEHPETGEDAKQIDALRSALEAVGEEDPRSVLLQASLAKSLSYGRHREERVRLAYVALHRSHWIQELPLKTTVLMRCHEALLGPEHLQHRVEIADQLTQLARDSGDAAYMMRAASTQIETCVERGDMAAVASAVSTMETLADDVREPFFRWHAKVVRSMQALNAGQLALAEQLARDAWSMGEPFGKHLAKNMYCAQVIGIFLLQDRVREAEPLVHEMSLRHPAIEGWRARIGVIDYMQGRHDAARRALDELMDRKDAWLRVEPFALSCFCSAAELCGWIGDPVAAEVLYRELLPYAEHIGLVHLGGATYGPVSRLLAILAGIRGEVREATDHFEHALTKASDVESTVFWCLTAVAYAEFLLLVGGGDDRSRGTALLAETIAWGDRCGLTAVTRYARDLVSRHDLQLAVLEAARVTPS